MAKKNGSSAVIIMLVVITADVVLYLGIDGLGVLNEIAFIVRYFL